MEDERGRPFDERRGLIDVEREAALEVRRNFDRDSAIESDAAAALGFESWVATEWGQWFLRILAGAPEEPIAVTAFGNLASAIASWWATDADHRRERRSRNFQAEATLADLLASFALRVVADAALLVVQPLVQMAERHPREASSFVRDLVVAEDHAPAPTTNFWLIWARFAEAVRTAQWLSRIDEEHARGRELLGAVLLSSGWKDDARDWKSLAGHDDVRQFFESLPPSAAALEDYARFLYRIGGGSLPGALVPLARQIRRGDAVRLLARANTVFILETLLRRFVYGRPAELKRSPELRDAVLALLDSLVESGSSAAFLMRDDFVTPGSSQA